MKKIIGFFLAMLMSGCTIIIADLAIVEDGSGNVNYQPDSLYQYLQEAERIENE